MAKALKVKVTTKAADSVMDITEMTIGLIHQSSGITYTAKIPLRNNTSAVDELLLNVFRWDYLSIFEDSDPLMGKIVAYIPDKDELRPSGIVFPFSDYMRGITEKDYDLTVESDTEYAMLYKRIRGE
jgi:hypothetical protein